MRGSPLPGSRHRAISTISGRLGRKHLAVSSSIWDSMGMSESCVEGESFLALPAELSLVLVAGGPVEGRQPLSVVRSELCKRSLSPLLQGSENPPLTAGYISNRLCPLHSPDSASLCLVVLTWPSTSTPHLCHVAATVSDPHTPVPHWLPRSLAALH